MTPKVSGHFDHIIWTHFTVKWRSINIEVGIDIHFVILGFTTNRNTPNSLFNVEGAYIIQNYRINFCKKDNLNRPYFSPV